MIMLLVNFACLLGVLVALFLLADVLYFIYRKGK